MYYRVRNTQRRTQRKGLAIIMVIAFYAIAVTMTGVWVRTALDHQRQVRRWHEKSQVNWLAESGLALAVARLGEKDQYEGEEWQLSADELGGNSAATVVIRVEPLQPRGPASRRSTETSRLVRITATARYPVDQHRVQATKTLDFRLPVTSDLLGESS